MKISPGPAHLRWPFEGAKCRNLRANAPANRIFKAFRDLRRRSERDRWQRSESAPVRDGCSARRPIGPDAQHRVRSRSGSPTCRHDRRPNRCGACRLGAQSDSSGPLTGDRQRACPARYADEMGRGALRRRAPLRPHRSWSSLVLPPALSLPPLWRFSNPDGLIPNSGF